VSHALRALLLALGLVLVAAPAGAAWREARSAHFIIYSEEKADTLHSFATKLERFDAALRFLLKLPPREDGPNTRLTVFLVASGYDVNRLVGGEGVAGYYRGRIGRSTAVVPRRPSQYGLPLDTVLLHEYTHHFLHRNLPGAFPTWFSEGFAEFNATTQFHEDGSIDFGLPARHRNNALFEMDRLPIQMLLDGNYSRLIGEQLLALYGRGWLLTHYLLFAPERQGQLDTYLAEIGRGQPNRAAAEKAFGDIAKLGSDLERYKRQRQLPYSRLDAKRLAVGPVEVRELSAGANAIMPVHLRARGGASGAVPETLAAEARRVARDHPDDPFVLHVLAEAELRAERYEAADAALEKLLAQNPDDVPALTLQGSSAIGRLRAARSRDAEAWKAARRWLIRANTLDPLAPEPLLRFYQSFEAAGEAPTANAIDALISAHLLAREDDGLRYTLGWRLLKDGKTEEARRVLAPAAYSPHGRGAALIRTVLDALDAGGPADALAAWDAERKDRKKPVGEDDEG
jgi:tetratricopeptide (TPR) repeat protein